MGENKHNLLKYDILNDVRTEKYYLEMDLVQIANNNDISYKEKIQKIKKILEKIVINDSIGSLTKEYFVERENNENKKEE